MAETSREVATFRCMCGNVHFDVTPIDAEKTAAELSTEYEQWRRTRDDAVYGFVGAATAIVRGVKQEIYSSPQQGIRYLEEELRKVCAVLGWDTREIDGEMVPAPTKPEVPYE